MGAVMQIIGHRQRNSERERQQRARGEREIKRAEKEQLKERRIYEDSLVEMGQSV
jgi:hypothetical protein